MKQVNLTDVEFNLVKSALEMKNDVMVDTLFEDIPELFPSDDNPTVLNRVKATQLKNQMYEKMTEMVNLQATLKKFGISVNDEGYTV